MRAAMWMAVVLLALIAGMQAYAMSRTGSATTSPSPATPSATTEPGSPLAETAELWRLRRERVLNQLKAEDAELLNLLERRDAERRLREIRDPEGRS